MNILLLDNYDSFTHNLYQLVGEILEKKDERFSLSVLRNDEVSLNDIKKSRYTHIIISPGPGDPSDRAYFGVCADVLLSISKTIPTLGVCLGMQGMAHYFGGRVVPSLTPMHGKTSSISHDGKGVFHGLPQHIEVMRYHSLVCDFSYLPRCLEVTARVEGSGAEIMGLRHVTYPLEGVQFHPESFATEGGLIMMSNFLFQKENL